MKLTREILKSRNEEVYADFSLPEKVLQFGDDECVRGGVDWMIHRMNRRGYFEGRIVTVQPLKDGNSRTLNGQDGLYTLVTREPGENSKEIVSSISRSIDPYTEFATFLDCAKNPDLRIIVSNTGAAGIAFCSSDRPSDRPPSSFPAKATVLLLRRFIEFQGDPSKGFIFLPCEPVSQNGDMLRSTILAYCRVWNLGEDFTRWVESSNVFLNALIDRIVTGFPAEEMDTLAAELGYEDELLDTAEAYHLIVIQGDGSCREEIPFAEAGLNAIWTDDLTPYWKRKQRLLNGIYTMSVFAAYLTGKNTLRECTEDEQLVKFMREGLMEEVIASLNIPRLELNGYAAEIVKRFSNPFMTDDLLSAASFGIEKFRDRVMPSVLEYMGRRGRVPRILSMSLSALLAFYRGKEIRGNCLIGRRNGEEYAIRDHQAVLSFFRTVWSDFDGTEESLEAVCRRILGNTAIWGYDLSKHSSLLETVAGDLGVILRSGIHEAFAVRESISA